MHKVLLFALLLSSNLVFAQLLTFNFDAIPAATLTPTYPSSTNAVGVAPSTIQRGSGLNVETGAGKFNSSGFTNAFDTANYLQFALSPVTGYRLNPSSVTVYGVRTTTGPTTFVIRTSLDDFAANATNVVTLNTTNVTSLQFVFNQPVSITTPIIIRLYGYGATNGNGTFAIGGQTGPDLIVDGPTPIALPVKFDNVKVVKKASGIQVSFSNLTESDVINYTIERSANGQQYTTVKEMAPAKNDGGRADYAYIDAQPLSGVNHYRIKVTEQTGKTVYSASVKWNTGLLQPGLTIYPNPVKGAQLSFQVNNLAAGMYKVAILNTTGQVVVSQSIKHEGGSLAQTISTQQLKKGMYYLEVNGAEPLRKAFVVQ